MTNIRVKNKWNVLSPSRESDEVVKLASELGCSTILAAVLYRRGYTDADSAKTFINKSHEILYDPFLLNDMEIAVQRIIGAISKDEKITIYGDYDVDGVTSVSILYLYLQSIGANVNYYIPHRKTEGYGVSVDALEKIKEQGTNLIITVDTGITAVNEIDASKVLGMDVIITDHHECPDILPNALAVINPKRQDSPYPFKQLAGVGVVFKLICAIEARYSNISIREATGKIAYKYADLTAIGTIVDVMPVIDENRIIIAYGLERAENTDNLGLSALINLCRNGDGKSYKNKSKKRLNASFVSYSIGPRINAAGRLGTASTAVELFLSRDEKEANDYAYLLGEINKERQFEENKIIEETIEIIKNDKLYEKNIIILDSEIWHNGVVGIVSSRVTDKYGIPSMLISFEGNEDPFDDEAIGKGSGRSIPGMNLFEALSTCSDILEKFGGHELAAGLTIKRKHLKELIERLEAFAGACFEAKERERIIEIDDILETKDITLDLCKELALLEPCGTSNNPPLFLTKNMIIEDIIPLSMNKHIKLILSKNNQQFSALLFSVSPEDFWLSIHDEVDVAYNLEINEYNGLISLQLSVRDIVQSERSLLVEKQNETLYTEVKEGKSSLNFDYIFPERDDFGIVYKHLLSCARCGQDKYTYTRLTNDINKLNAGKGINYIKVRIIIKVFIELNIVGIEELDENSFSFKISYTKNKANLDKSSILKNYKTIYQKKQ